MRTQHRTQRNRRGVFTLDFAFLLVIVTLILFPVARYLMNAGTGRYSSMGDSLGSQVDWSRPQKIVSQSMAGSIQEQGTTDAATNGQYSVDTVASGSSTVGTVPAQQISAAEVKALGAVGVISSGGKNVDYGGGQVQEEHTNGAINLGKIRNRGLFE